MKSAREIALQALVSFRKDGAFSDLVLKNALSSLTREDAALSSAITYGVLQNMDLIDFFISSYSSIKLKKITPIVLDAIRCGVYQLAFMDKIPDFAAVNETVSLVKKHANPRAASFANAVLHKIADNKKTLPKTDDICLLTSHPKWLYDRLKAQIGDNAAADFLRANNSPAPLYIRTNTLKISSDELISRLSEKGIILEKTDLADCLLCKSTVPLQLTEEFKNGLFYIQDLASQLAVSMLAPQNGDTIIDMCASPGGKTCLAACLMQNCGTIKAFDIHPHKTAIIDENADRLGISCIVSAACDSSKHISSLEKSADKIICDVPCSGMGIIRKKPDIRYKNEEDVSKLPETQYAILQNAASYLKSGGRMLYSTCTVLKEENDDIIDRFLSENSDFYRIPFAHSVCGETSGSITLYPHIHNCDGFFITILGRK